MTAWDNSAFVDCMSMSAPVNLAGYGVAPDHFRSLAASLPTGVAVITTAAADAEPLGLTCGTVCSLSCQPPLLLACVGLGSRTLTALRARKAFVVNVLAADAERLATRFAGQLRDKFAGVEWATGKHGLPVLQEGTVAHAECELYRVVKRRRSRHRDGPYPRRRASTRRQPADVFQARLFRFPVG